uniref:Uncharacterized protein n=1 Tax=Anguilla anguilla TaxID=7936 RepID=A0A0E9TFP8_ANGAN
MTNAFPVFNIQLLTQCPKRGWIKPRYTHWPFAGSKQQPSLQGVLMAEYHT